MTPQSSETPQIRCHTVAQQTPHPQCIGFSSGYVKNDSSEGNRASGIAHPMYWTLCPHTCANAKSEIIAQSTEEMEHWGDRYLRGSAESATGFKETQIQETGWRTCLTSFGHPNQL